MTSRKRLDQTRQILARLKRADIQHILAVDAVFDFDALDFMGSLNAAQRRIEAGIGHADPIGPGAIPIDQIAYR